MSRLGTIARRSFLIGSVAIAGGVAFGWYAYRKPIANPLLEEGQAVALTPYVMIDASGVTIIAPRAEMGQGVHTTLAALVAEEMDLPMDQIKVHHGPASPAYFNAALLEEGVPFAPTDQSWFAESMRGAMHIPAKFLGLQLTGGSSSTPDAYTKMRQAGAMARAVLVKAAAAQLGLTEATLKTEGGAVLAPDGTRLSYIDLAAAAALIDLPADAPLKDRANWAQLGKSQPRTDMVAKVTGTAQYAGDVRLPGQLFATVRTNPGLGAAMISYDAAAALTMPGVKHVLAVDGGIAVVATSTWAAFQAADAVTFEWAAPSYPASSADQAAQVAASFTPDFQDSQSRDDGDVTEALKTGISFATEYSVPYLAHATMEPMVAVAHVQDAHVDVWAGNQLPTQVLVEAASITGLKADQIDVHTTLMGGGFGRRAEMDFIRQTLQVATQLHGTPVLLQWSRTEDMTHDAYRPMAAARVNATLQDGIIHAMDLQVAAPSVLASQGGRLGFTIPGPDATIVQGAKDQPYAFPNYRVTGYRVPAGVPVGSWRSVGSSQNAFFHESAVDELAHLAGIDPVQFRLSQIAHAPSLKVIEAVAAMASWGTPLPQGRARGFAYAYSFGVPVAEVIEVEQTDAGIKMTNIWAAVDVGIALDPGIIEAQVQGGIVYGLSAAIRGEITFADGRVQQSNFSDYEPLRLYQCPPIAVTILENGEKIRGIGEPGTPPAAPALANAIFALTGQRIRSLPLGREVVFA
jgi:isoquinoline 1-oxidoreductase subunit beta